MTLPTGWTLDNGVYYAPITEPDTGTPTITNGTDTIEAVLGAFINADSQSLQIIGYVCHNGATKDNLSGSGFCAEKARLQIKID